jgi:DNA-binding GntR family transcriptional regulator
MMSDSFDHDSSRADFVYTRLRQGIHSGEFRPGQRLRETELATRLKVSRTPIREALRRLSSDGLVELAPSRGVMIVELDRQRVREIYALRETLEGSAARLAAQYASPAELQSLGDILERLHQPGVSPALAADINRLFHRTIHDAAHNRYLTRALDQLSDFLALLPGTTFEVPGRLEQSRAEHYALLEALTERAPDKAEQVARQHIQVAARARIHAMFERPELGRSYRRDAPPPPPEAQAGGP